MAVSSSVPGPAQHFRAPIQPRAKRRENHRQKLLDTAANLFRRKGYQRTSVRDIASASGLLPGSIYCHFPSKDQIFLAVQERGIGQLTQAVRSAIREVAEPWARLEAACIAHMEHILADAGPVRVNPERGVAPWERVAALRDDYENIFRQLIDDLPLPPGTNRKYLRLTLFGSMNWVQNWYRAGRDTPERIAVEIVWLFRCGLDPE